VKNLNIVIVCTQQDANLKNKNLYRVERYDDTEDVLEKILKEAVWSNMEYFSFVCLEGMRDTTKCVIQNSRSSGRDLKLGSLEYESVALTTRPRYSTQNSDTRRYRKEQFM
jgi:hypothetical protein